MDPLKRESDHAHLAQTVQERNSDVRVDHMTRMSVMSGVFGGGAIISRVLRKAPVAGTAAWGLGTLGMLALFNNRIVAERSMSSAASASATRIRLADLGVDWDAAKEKTSEDRDALREAIVSAPLPDLAASRLAHYIFPLPRNVTSRADDDS